MLTVDLLLLYHCTASLLFCMFLVDGWRYLERLGVFTRVRVYWALRRKRWSLAERWATRAVQERRTLRRYRVACLLGRACSLAHRGLVKQALDDCDTVLAEEPRLPAALLLKGALLCDTGRYQEALEPLRTGVLCRQKSAEMRWALAAAARQVGLLAECHEALAVCLWLKPQALLPLQMRAEVLAEMGRYQESLADYDRLLKLQPTGATLRGGPLDPLVSGQVSARLHLALHLIGMGRNREGAFWAERHLQENGREDPLGHMALALALTELNDHAGAVRSCDLVLSHALSAYALWLRGTNAWVLGNLTQAASDLEWAAAIDHGRNPAVAQLWRDFRAHTGQCAPRPLRITVN